MCASVLDRMDGGMSAVMEMTVGGGICRYMSCNGRPRGWTGVRRAGMYMRLFIYYVRHIEKTRNFGRYIMTGHVKTERRVSSLAPRRPPAKVLRPHVHLGWWTMCADQWSVNNVCTTTLDDGFRWLL